MGDISIIRIVDLLVTLPVFAAFLTELAAVKAKPPITIRLYSDCIQPTFPFPLRTLKFKSNFIIRVCPQ